jgi:hypothetical protein
MQPIWFEHPKEDGWNGKGPVQCVRQPISSNSKRWPRDQRFWLPIWSWPLNSFNTEEDNCSEMNCAAGLLPLPLLGILPLPPPLFVPQSRHLSLLLLLLRGHRPSPIARSSGSGSRVGAAFSRLLAPASPAR